jgi:phosphomannomutase
MKKQVEQWLLRDPDPQTRQELSDLINQGDWSEIKQRFSTRLQFGTAGLRGEVGAGPNRMNRLVIQETSLGLGHYLLDQIPNAAERGVIIGYDGRLQSKQYAMDTASVLTSLNIKVYLTKHVAPTPTIAYGINKLKTAAGIVVTASHNPPQDNGFKVYWQNGAQIIAPHDQGIAQAIELASHADIPFCELNVAEEQNLLTWLDDTFFNEYQAMVLEGLHQTSTVAHTPFDIAYTPMHGVGASCAEALITKQGVCRIHTVASQREPDGLFPTVAFPNPEEPGAMDRVIQLAQEIGANYAIANDPDADRFAMAVRTPDDSFRMLTGDQVGALLAEHILSTRRNVGWVGNTIVSSSLLEKIAIQNHTHYYQTLTGFKWLANVAMEKQSKEIPFLFAYEEALGYAIGQQVWDKDGLNALVTCVEMIDTLTQQNKTIWDQLEHLYRRHGLHITAQKSIRLASGSASIGDTLRQTPPTHIAGQKVITIQDYKTSMEIHYDGRESAITLPKSDVLIYVLDDQSRIVVRPSGTEPKLKCYYERITPLEVNESFWVAEQQAQHEMQQLIKNHQTTLDKLLPSSSC